MPLTDTFCRKVKAGEKAKKYADAESMYLYVTPAGTKLWRLDYQFGGQRKTLSLGQYPVVSLADAQMKMLDAKKLIEQGIDPCARKAAAKAVTRSEGLDDFEMVAREWFANMKGKWVEAHAARVIAKLENYIFPIIGKTPIADVEAPGLLGRCE